jgi:chemotaxis protein CheD
MSPPRQHAETDCATGAERRIHVVQGEYFVTDDPGAMLTTILGSCVAACIRDPLARVGGMNHFLLPGDERSDSLRYGVQSMELLVNGLLKRGAQRNRLEAKLFGGARVVGGLTDIGDQNALFAERFLMDEGIVFTGGSLGGALARRIQYWPATGRARQLFLAPAEAMVGRELELKAAIAPKDDGQVELF